VAATLSQCALRKADRDCAFLVGRRIDTLFVTAETLLQQPIFYLQVFDHLKLPTIDPAGKQRQEELPRLGRPKHPGKYPVSNSAMYRSFASKNSRNRGVHW
jgi:hypothetical protein